MPSGVYQRSEKQKRESRNRVLKIGEKTRFKKGHVSFWRGKHLTEETKEKLSKSHRGLRASPEARAKMSKSQKERYKDGMPEEQKRKIGASVSIARKGTKLSEEHKRKIGVAIRKRVLEGKHNWWKGGVSYEPYSVDWTETLKRAIRERDNYICQLCSQYGNIVHHIDYDKKNCNPENLITLCRRCHVKTNFGREAWTEYFVRRRLMTQAIKEATK